MTGRKCVKKRSALGVLSAICLSVMTLGLRGCGKTPETVQNSEPQLNREAGEEEAGRIREADQDVDLVQNVDIGSDLGDSEGNGTETWGYSKDGFTSEYVYSADEVYQLVLPEGDGEFFVLPYLGLDTEHRAFIFSYDTLSSYLYIGSYKIENDLLTASTDDGRYIWLFRIVDEDTIIFLQDGSSDVELIDHSFGIEIRDGVEFQREK